jgi:hypothetical protein
MIQDDRAAEHAPQQELENSIWRYSHVAFVQSPLAQAFGKLMQAENGCVSLDRQFAAGKAVRDIGAEERLLLAFCTPRNEHAASFRPIASFSLLISSSKSNSKLNFHGRDVSRSGGSLPFRSG